MSIRYLYSDNERDKPINTANALLNNRFEWLESFSKSLLMTPFQTKWFVIYFYPFHICISMAPERKSPFGLRYILLNFE